jgi:hypothetical protein
MLGVADAGALDEPAGVGLKLDYLVVDHGTPSAYRASSEHRLVQPADVQRPDQSANTGKSVRKDELHQAVLQF